MRAVITAGGTAEPIDDVRVVTNLSTGRFGAHIANALVARGIEVTLLASHALMLQPSWVDSRVQRVPFGSFDDLARVLDDACRTPPDLLFMAAAVSDYSPVPAEGKIRSTEDRLVIEMERNPKLLSRLRSLCGPDTFLVGFKLLSGVPHDELVSVARAQLEKAHLDLTVANDLQTFAPGLHPIVLVSAADVQPHAGSKAEVAEALVRTALDRAGHVPDARRDTWLCAHLPGVAEVRAIPGALVVPTARLQQPTAPGSLAEALAIHAVLAAVRAGPDFTVTTHDGPLLGLSAPATYDRWWEGQRKAFEASTRPLGGSVSAMHPAVVDDRLVGVWAELDGFGVPAHTLWLDPRARDAGDGDRLIREVAHRDVAIAAHEDCGLHDFYVSRGFLVEAVEGPVTLYASPVRHGKAAEAASVCLVQPLLRKVLLGRRRAGAYLGYWAFPGGGVDPGESHARAADRELTEETHIERPPGPEILKTSIHVGDGSRVWRLLNFAYTTLAMPTPIETDELSGAWLDLDTALGLSPMASGTRTVLRRITDRLE